MGLWIIFQNAGPARGEKAGYKGYCGGQNTGFMVLVVGGEVEKECLSQFVVKALCVIMMLLSSSLWAVAVWFLMQVSVGTSCVL